MLTLQWCHNGWDGITDHQSHDCLLNGLFRHRSKKTSKLRITSLCAGNSPVTGKFPTQRDSNVGNVSIWWRHHEIIIYCIFGPLFSKTHLTVGFSAQTRHYSHKWYLNWIPNQIKIVTVIFNGSQSDQNKIVHIPRQQSMSCNMQNFIVIGPVGCILNDVSSIFRKWECR